MKHQGLTLGSALERICQEASDEVLLVAPFVKASALARLLESISETAKLTCVTRWRPADIMAGVSDLEVFSIIDGHGGTLWLRQGLHAKYFRGDDNVLVGSANLTDSALGWSSNPNLELLINVDLRENGLEEFEKTLFKAAVQVDKNLYETFLESADNWKLSAHLEDHRDVLLEETFSFEPRLNLESWVPSCRSPADLFRVYQPFGSEVIPTETLRAGKLDLAILRPPLGLTADEFKGVIAASLLAIPIFNSIDRFVIEPRRFGEVREYLQQEFALSHEESTRAWQTIIRWIRHFLPERYEYNKPNYSEIILRKS